MPFSAKVFVPKSLIGDPAKLARAVANGLDGAAAGALIDFKVTTATWQHQPAFDTSSPNEASRVVGTDDTIYRFVNEGTRPHIIVAHGKGLAFNSGGFRPKSRVRVIGSNAGSAGGSPIVRPMVHHPGTEARQFDQAIAEKWNKQLAVVMQRAIDAEF